MAFAFILRLLSPVERSGVADIPYMQASVAVNCANALHLVQCESLLYLTSSHWHHCHFNLLKLLIFPHVEVCSNETRHVC